MLDDLGVRHLAALSLALATKTRTVRLGRTFTLHLTVKNAGPDTAAAAKLTLTLPDGLSLVRVASTGLRCTLAPLQCALAQLPAARSINAVLTLRLTAAGRHTVSASAATLIASNPNPNSARQQLTIRSALP